MSSTLVFEIFPSKKVFEKPIIARPTIKESPVLANAIRSAMGDVEEMASLKIA